MALALVITASKLRPYFLSYPVGVRTNILLKQVLGKPETSGRLIKWAIELSEYDISYLPRTTVKAQALADFVSEMTGTTLEEVLKARPWLPSHRWLVHCTREWSRHSTHYPSRKQHGVCNKV
ncbi:UNVERIFIED_CONTAM: hypothetical protein Sradi_2071000 [Sesamum radiatum]|uniref:Reverse transcriptase RNase H-like domain-containing protein n=1 Tax=Sesamum radiatum TaxID=300843 RepID=A0AAW2TJ29_SESRA